nr:MAG TPA: hypothetical protein [Caudoviricetes sp.]
MPPPCSRSPPSHEKKNQHTMCTGFWCEGGDSNPQG